VDGLILKLLTDEIAEALRGKMVQSLSFYGKSAVFSTETGDLAFHLGGQEPWIQYAPSAGLKEKSSSVPFFNYMKKNMAKGRVSFLTLRGDDRIVALGIKSLQALGMTEMVLVTELIPGNVNAFILQQGMILNMWKPDKTRRALETGDDYVLPAPSRETSPYLFSSLVPAHLRQEMSRRGLSEEDEGPFIGKLLSSPGYCIVKKGNRFLLTLLPYEDSEIIREFQSAVQAVNVFYGEILKKENLSRAKDEMKKYIKKEIQKTQKTLEKVKEEEKKHSHYEKYKKMGDLLLIYASQISGYKEMLSLRDPETEQEVQVPYQPSLTPAENAQKYFKRYTRGKRAGDTVKRRAAALLYRERYLQEALYYAGEAESKEALAELGEELNIPAYRKGKTQKGKKETRLDYRRIEYAGGIILYGKSGRSNERLSLKVAAPDDIWLHVRNIPGAHVIIKTENEGKAPPSLLHAAAQVAVYYSRSRGGGKVPVDVTKARHVRKPKGTPAGFVLYDHFETVFIDQDMALIRSLLGSDAD